MAKTAKPGEPAITRDLTPERTTCLACGRTSGPTTPTAEHRSVPEIRTHRVGRGPAVAERIVTSGRPLWRPASR